MKATTFVFEKATFQQKEGRADFFYAIHFADQKPLRFKETLRWPATAKNKIPRELQNAFLQDLHLVLGVSYYKLYCPKTIQMPYLFTRKEAEFWSTLYRKGLGEFFYRNQIEFQALCRFKASKTAKTPRPTPLATEEKALLGIGGGKDSIVAGELLKGRKIPLTGFVLETEKPSPVVNAVCKTMGIKKLTVHRTLDPKLFKPLPGATNGHVPISAIFAMVGAFTAALFGYRYTVVANEASSNFGNLRYRGGEINHQWSKSTEFEAAFQEHLRQTRTPSVEYFSAIRHFYEIRTVESFTRYPKYFPIFTSCNRNFRVHHQRPGDLWCGECPKCAFVFAQLAAFLPPQKLLSFFPKNLFEERALVPLFTDLAGLGKLKPFDCVGTFEETRAALRLAQKNWGKTTVLSALLPSVNQSFSTDNDATLFAIQDAPTLPAHFKFLGLKNTLLLGYGKEGVATEAYLKKYYPHLTILLGDQSKKADYLKLQDEAEFAVRTPGLPKKNLHLPYTTATNIFLAQTRSTTIGITGSKGKSTTASLIAHLLKAGGFNVELLGNIGRPMLSALMKPEPRGRISVLELSSYQLDDCTRSPHIAVVTNLFPEHMNYHGGIEPYYNAKKNLLRHQTPADVFVVNTKHPLLKKWVKETPAQPLPFATQTPSELPLLGEHNRSNAAAALAIAKQFHLSTKIVSKALRSFKALPHRLEKVGTFKGITFYDDAISTSPESTLEALKALTPLAPIGTIFLGGEDRGYDFTELEKALHRYKIKNVVLFPRTGERILSSSTNFNTLKTSSMQAAVAFAIKHSPKGSICLLSTASPSYSVWKNFEEKGEEFQREVREQTQGA